MGIIASLVAVGLAVGYLLIAWRDSSLFEPLIAWLEDGMLVDSFDYRFGKPGYYVAAYITDLLLCPLCLSPWMCLGVHLLYSQQVMHAVLCGFASAAISFAYYKKFSLNAED